MLLFGRVSCWMLNYNFCVIYNTNLTFFMKNFSVLCELKTLIFFKITNNKV
jgi:hypothetical protein